MKAVRRGERLRQQHVGVGRVVRRARACPTRRSPWSPAPCAGGSGTRASSDSRVRITLLRSHDARGRIEHAIVLDPIGDERRVVRDELRGEHRLARLFPDARHHQSGVGAHAAGFLVAHVDRRRARPAASARDDAHAAPSALAPIHDAARCVGRKPMRSTRQAITSRRRETQRELAPRIRQRSRDSAESRALVGRDDDHADRAASRCRGARRVPRLTTERGAAHAPAKAARTTPSRCGPSVPQLRITWHSRAPQLSRSTGLSILPKCAVLRPDQNDATAAIVAGELRRNRRRAGVHLDAGNIVRRRQADRG